MDNTRTFMSRAVLPLLVIVGGCGLVGDGSSVAPVSAAWMEWPSDVPPATAFGIRIVGFLPSCGSSYVRRYSVDTATISFTPFAVVPDEPPCVNIAPPMFIDSIVFAGLEVGTYQLRSRGEVFGELHVRSDPGESRWNAAGRGSIEPDHADCIRLRPSVLPAVRELPVENPPDTTPASGFVTGYIVSEATPLCGETRVFHLLSQN
jgi:hypothetical protein